MHKSVKFDDRNSEHESPATYNQKYVKQVWAKRRKASIPSPIKDKIMAYFEKHPMAASTDCSAALGCEAGYVRTVLKKEGVPLNGRITGGMSVAPDQRQDFNKEAKRRRLTPKQMERQILTIITADDLFAAILDR